MVIYNNLPGFKNSGRDKNKTTNGYKDQAVMGVKLNSLELVM